MALRTSSFNYSDLTPNVVADLLLVNSVDQEQFSLFGIKTVYYKIASYQENFDSIFRDLLSSKVFEAPIECRSFFKVDETTTHGMDVIGVGQVAERTGDVWFNISLLNSILGREPVIGDVLEDTQLHQKFEVFKISLEMFKLGRYIRYKLGVRLYQDQSGPTTYTK